MLKFLLILMSYSAAVVQATCPDSGQIHCGTSDKCINIRYICDGDDDCGDNSDEESQLCDAWRNDDCSRGEVECTRRESMACAPIETYCTITEDPCQGHLDRRLCQMLQNQKLQPLNDIIMPDSRGATGVPHYVELENGPGCGGNSLSDAEECGEAASMLGYRASVQSGSWGHAPYGCHVGHPTDNWRNTYFNSQHGQTGRDIYKSICLGADAATNLELTITKGEDFAEVAQYTLQSDKCPLLYTRIGDECLSIFFFGNATWGEARAFCQSIGGDLYVPETHENYHILVHHLREHYQTSDFWVGGKHYNASVGWRWVTDEPIELGTPHWAIRHNTVCGQREIYIEHRNVTLEANDGHCYHYTQAPAEVPYGDCVAMTYEKFFFLSDEDCLMRKSPLCKLADSSHLQEAAA